MVTNRRKHIISLIAIYIILAIVIFVVAFPLLYAFGGSFKTINEFLVGGTKIFPEEFQWNNYVRAWNQANFSRYTMNSVLFSLFSLFS